MPPQIKVSTQREDNRDIRGGIPNPIVENFRRLISLPSSISTISISDSQPKRGDTREPKRGMAIFIGFLHLVPMCFIPPYSNIHAKR